MNRFVNTTGNVRADGARSIAAPELLEIDEALNAEKKHGEVAPNPEKERSGKLAALLRNAGTAVLIGAAAVFLLQQWGEISHIARYFSFLAFTLLVSAAGLFCGVKIREDKGARTLLGVTLAILPVHFCQLGALIYSRVNALRGVKFHGPELLLWQAPSTLVAAATVAVGLAFILPLTKYSFTALARQLAGRLTLVYILQSLLLLLPTRDANVIAVLAALAIIHLVHLDSTLFRHETVMMTREGRIVRFMTWLPVSALIARSVYLYVGDLTCLFGSVLSAAIAVVLLIQLPRYTEKKGVAESLQAMSLFPALLSWVLLVGEVAGTIVPRSGAELLLYSLPMCGILMLMARYAKADVADGFRTLAITLGELSVIAALIIFGGIFSAFVLLAVSLVTATYGYAERRSGIFGIGVGGFIIGLLYHLRYAVDIIGYSPWISLAVLGIATVIFSSYVERSYSEIRVRIKALQGRFTSKDIA